MLMGTSWAIRRHAIASTYPRFQSFYAELGAIETAGNDLAWSVARKEVMKRDKR
jgi:hypothetical protein